METAEVLEVANEAVWVLLKVTLPIMMIALVTGLTISLFQALTQIQEMTLTFVPKLAAILVVFWMYMDFMTSSLATFFTSRIIPLIAGI